MNNVIREFIEKELITGLSKLPEAWINTFKRMYSYTDLEASLSKIVHSIPDGKVEWALSQIQNSLKRLEITKEGE